LGLHEQNVVSLAQSFCIIVYVLLDYLHTALKPSSVSTKFGSKYSHTLDLLTRVGVESSELSEVFVEVLVDMLDNIKHTRITILIQNHVINTGAMQL
jgi:hypothetical protein